jgi:3-oxoacyl-[acyl-carrier protein] reductase
VDLRDQVFLLTGCASGIGQHLASVLEEQGACALLTDARAEALQAQLEARGADESRIEARYLDVRNPHHWESALDRVIERWGRIDVLMNLAGVSRAGRIDEADPADIDLHIDVNTKGTLYGCRAASVRMVAQGHGHIVNFASFAGLAPAPGMSLYVASKFAVRGFSHAIATELAPRGVAVTVVCPDSVDTPMLAAAAKRSDALFNFSNGRILTVRDLERTVLERVLPKRPREVLVPASTGVAMRLLTAFPRLGEVLLPLIERRAARHQSRYLESLGDASD